MEKQEEAGGTQVIGWDLAAMSQEDMEVNEELWRKRAKERAHLGAKSMQDEVESEADSCQEALSKVLEAPAKHITACAPSKRSWNGEIQEKRSQLGRKLRRWRWSAETADGNIGLQHSVRRAQRKMRNDCLKTLRGAEVW